MTKDYVFKNLMIYGARLAGIKMKTSLAQLRSAHRSSDYCLNQIGLVQISFDELKLFGFSFYLVLVGCKSGLASEGFSSVKSV